MKIIRFVASALALMIAFGVGMHIAPTPSRWVNVYENEDLSGAAYAQPISSISVHRSQGWVCYANDRSGQDQRQLYVACAEYLNEGGKIAP